MTQAFFGSMGTSAPKMHFLKPASLTRKCESFSVLEAETSMYCSFPTDPRVIAAGRMHGQRKNLGRRRAAAEHSNTRLQHVLCLILKIFKVFASHWIHARVVLYSLSHTPYLRVFWYWMQASPNLGFVLRSPYVKVFYPSRHSLSVRCLAKRMHWFLVEPDWRKPVAVQSPSHRICSGPVVRKPQSTLYAVSKIVIRQQKLATIHVKHKLRILL